MLPSFCWQVRQAVQVEKLALRVSHVVDILFVCPTIYQNQPRLNHYVFNTKPTTSLNVVICFQVAGAVLLQGGSTRRYLCVRNYKITIKSDELSN